MKSLVTVLCAITIFGCSHPHDKKLFRLLSASQTGISFANTIVENDSINPIDMEFLYNGGGVAVADFNHDGLQDLYFTGSMVSNKLYLNNSHLNFTDITAVAGVTGNNEWCNAATPVDINNDGWEDIYVCASISKDPARRRNLLYVNQGLNKDSIPVFKECAAEYGLADTSYSVQAAFSDFDNDGDLDMYLVTTRLAKREGAQFSSNKLGDTTGLDVDKLYRNDWNNAAGHPVFTDISRSAGITEHGFGLSVSVADINQDGWKDIYVANDFFGSDALYVNNHDGTFTNRIRSYFHHTSQNAMGNDIADINNDGLPDMVTVDMDPEDNFRKKKNLNSSNYYVYQNMMFTDVMLQYVRNTLQLNRGPQMQNADTVGDPVFSDISFYAGVAETDWSWNPSLADFDNDGYRDLIVTNGYPKDVTDHDFAAFRRDNSAKASRQDIIDQIPQIKIPNYAFRNEGNLHFENVTTQWGFEQPCFSTGAVYADLDNDGDLDYVINNINEGAYLYENNSLHTTQHALDLEPVGNKQNTDGYGAVADIYHSNKHQVAELSSTHGYLSSPGRRLHFGLGGDRTVDSIVIHWPGKGRKETLRNISADTLLRVYEQDAHDSEAVVTPMVNRNSWLTDVTQQRSISYKHDEADYIDFNDQRLIPHKLSQFGPGIAAGDVNGDGRQDLFVGGSGDFPGHFLIQEPSGHFDDKRMTALTTMEDRRPETLGVLLFDADNDGDNDLYCVSGSNEFAAATKNYQDRLYLNDGKGNFSADTAALPQNYVSKSCIKAADIDQDGDLDLFIGGRVKPGRYPEPVNSFIYRNDTKNGIVKFTDITIEACGALQNAGLVCDASWTDFDNDGLVDLIVVGEWMPITVFKNKGHGHFENVTAQTGVGSATGWWNSITPGDFDNDGDMDYIVGNLGENAFLRASPQRPVNLYAGDFDANGSIDLITTLFLKNRSGNFEEFPAANRDEMMEQLPGLKKKFLTYKSFGDASPHSIFTKTALDSSLHLSASEFRSCLLRNDGSGKFKLVPLPAEAQLAPLNGLVVEDIDDDGFEDVLVCGNDYGNEVTNGRYDALGGVLLLGNGDGRFRATTAMQSGFSVNGDAKALVKLRGASGESLFAVTQNRGPLKLFQQRSVNASISFAAGEDHALILLDNGRRRRVEAAYGSSYLSQSTNSITRGKQVREIDFYRGSVRTRVR